MPTQPDVINLSLFITAGVMRIRALSKAPVFDFNDADTFVNFQTVALLATSERNVLAINAALVWFKLLKYMAFLPGFQLISRTLVESIKSVVTITMVSLSIIMGFAVSGVLAFGDDVAGFETTTHAFISLYRSLNGEIDYAGLRASNRVLGPVFFVTFNVMVVLVFLNLFLATSVSFLLFFFFVLLLLVGWLVCWMKARWDCRVLLYVDGMYVSVNLVSG